MKKTLLALAVIAALATIGGCASMRYESAYPRTAPGKTEVKQIPASVVLVATGNGAYFSSSNGLFGKLFRFIRDNDVKMTVPVEADMDPGVMRFYVGKKDRAKPLNDTADVAVATRAPRTVLALGVRGGYTRTAYEKALKSLRAHLAENPSYETAGEPYMVYWNSPFVPGFLKKSELHIPLRPPPQP